MRSGSRIAVTSAALVCVALIGAEAMAGGFTFPELTSKGVGRGGAYMLGASGPEVIFFNPALLTRLEGYTLTLDVSFHKLDVEYTREGTVPGSDPPQDFETVSSGFEGFPCCGFFPEPMLFMSADFGLDDFAFGLGVYGPNAVGVRRFPIDGPQRFALVESKLIQVFYSAAAAWRWEGLRLGGTFQIATLDIDFTTVTSSSFVGNLLANENPGDDVVTNIKANGLEPTGILGVAYDVSPSLSFGLTYQLPLSYEAEGEAKLDCQGALGDLGANLVNDGAVIKISQADILRASARYAHIEGDREIFDIELSGTYERWSRNKSFDVSIEGPIEVPILPDPQELADTIIIKEWQDTFSVRLGGDYNPLDVLSVRAGVFFETAATPNATTNLDFISFDRVGAGLGATYALGFMDIDLGYLFVNNFDRTVTNGKVDITAPLVQGDKPIINNGDYSATHQTVTLGVTMHFDDQPVHAQTPVVRDLSK